MLEQWGDKVKIIHFFCDPEKAQYVCVGGCVTECVWLFDLTWIELKGTLQGFVLTCLLCDLTTE